MGEFLLLIFAEAVFELAKLGLYWKPLYEGEGKCRRVGPCVLGVLCVPVTLALILGALPFVAFLAALVLFLMAAVLRLVLALRSGKYSFKKKPRWPS